MKSVLITLALLAFSFGTPAKVIHAEPPIGLFLKHDKRFLGNPDVREHGLERFCFSNGSSYVAYERNVVGEGDSLSKIKPFKNCKNDKNPNWASWLGTVIWFN